MHCGGGGTGGMEELCSLGSFDYAFTRVGLWIEFGSNLPKLQGFHLHL